MGRFLPGHTPWNRGIKGLTGRNITSFRNGNVPKNTRYDGAISFRKHSPTNQTYIYIRTSAGKWQLLHRWVWEKYNGPLPEKWVVCFKNRDTLDCRIDNLEAISCADNARRNANYLKTSKSLKKTWRRDKLRIDYGLAPITGFGVRLLQNINP